MGELTVPGYDPAVHISVSDIAVDCPTKPSLIELVLKCSKTDKLGRGAHIYIGRTDTELCPVAALIAYLAVRGIFVQMERTIVYLIVWWNSFQELIMRLDW